MIGAEHCRLPGEGRDPFLPWAPAFAGVTEFLMSALLPTLPFHPEWVGRAGR
jgi:hypothetical protein